MIVGAGPAGLFAADELIDNAYAVTVIEEMSRVGGQGLNIDGKFNFHPKIGGDLTDFLSEAESWKLITDIEATFEKYGDADKYYDVEKLNALQEKSIKAGIEFIKIQQKHIGSDLLPEIMDKFKRD